MGAFEEMFAASIAKNKSVNPERIKISWGNPANINWAIKTSEGYEIWEEMVSSHAYKNREYAPRLVETISPAEFKAREKKEEVRVTEVKASEAKMENLKNQTFFCPCCERETNKLEGEEYEGELLCPNCLSGMYE